MLRITPFPDLHTALAPEPILTLHRYFIRFSDYSPSVNFSQRLTRFRCKCRTRNKIRIRAIKMKISANAEKLNAIKLCAAISELSAGMSRTSSC